MRVRGRAVAACGGRRRRRLGGNKKEEEKPCALRPACCRAHARPCSRPWCSRARCSLLPAPAPAYDALHAAPCTSLRLMRPEDRRSEMVVIRNKYVTQRKSKSKRSAVCAGGERGSKKKGRARGAARGAGAGGSRQPAAAHTHK
jgi:hypothetical protein